MILPDQVDAAIDCLVHQYVAVIRHNHLVIHVGVIECVTWVVGRREFRVIFEDGFDCELPLSHKTRVELAEV